MRATARSGARHPPSGRRRGGWRVPDRSRSQPGRCTWKRRDVP